MGNRFKTAFIGAAHKGFQDECNAPIMALAARAWHIADFEPKGAVARGYGVYDEKAGEAERALFVIDSEGVIRWSYVSPVGINPGADGILRALESLVQGQGQSGTAGLHRPQHRGMV